MGRRIGYHVGHTLVGIQDDEFGPREVGIEAIDHA